MAKEDRVIVYIPDELLLPMKSKLSLHRISLSEWIRRKIKETLEQDK